MRARLLEQRAIHRYVFENGPWSPGVTSVSCFRAAVRDARQLTGRDVDTGATRKRLRKGVAIWPGTLVYLVLLDQLGQVLAPKRRDPTREPFLDALTEFAPALTEQDRQMLYALRCAFAHEYALSNVGRGKQQTAALRQHQFELHVAGERRLAVYPKHTWNGRHGHRANDKTGTTKVNLTEVGNVVEEVVGRVEAGASSGTLRLLRGVSPAMVSSRWGYREYDVAHLS